jgi:hypothetical protein
MPNIKSDRLALETHKAVARLFFRRHEMINAGRLEDAEILRKEISSNLEKCHIYTDAEKIFETK